MPRSCWRHFLRRLTPCALAALLLIEQGRGALWANPAAKTARIETVSPSLSVPDLAVSVAAPAALPDVSALAPLPAVEAPVTPHVEASAVSAHGVSGYNPALPAPNAAAAPEIGYQAGAQQFDGEGKLDPFGRDLGWDQMPAAPADAVESIKDVSLEHAGKAFTPSPQDWRDEIFYSIMFDRFDRQAPYSAWGDEAKANTRHGGNIRGTIRRLDYLKNLGVTTLLVSPIFMNPPSGYHQYWAVHFLAVDPQLGTKADFQELVREAHQRGMRVVLDMVFNHTGPVIEYEGGFKFGPPKKIKKWAYPVKPVELQDPQHFSRRGDIGDWNDQDQILHGDLPGGVNHFDTDNKATQDLLLTIAKYWIKETDVDGFRLDVYKHVSPKMWDRVFKEVREYASGLGKKNFLLVGELYDGDAKKLAPEVGHGRLDSAYNYPAYYSDMDALRGKAPTRQLEDAFLRLEAILGQPLHWLVRFLDNHDRPRFLKDGEPVGKLKAALGYIMTTVGIPYLFYGTEQGFRSNPNREKLDLEASRDDLFAQGKFRDPRAPGFDESSDMYRFIAALSKVRALYPALRRGQQYVRWSDRDAAGLFAFSRIDGGEEVLVALNTADTERKADMWVDAHLTGAGVELVDALDPSFSTKTWAQDGGSRVAVTVPAHGVRVLARRPKAPAR